MAGIYKTRLGHFIQCLGNSESSEGSGPPSKRSSLNNLIIWKECLFWNMENELKRGKTGQGESQDYK